MTHVCKFFRNQPKDGYRPIGCKEPIAYSKENTSTGRKNYAEVFYTLRGNTLKENATIDLILPIPDWLKQSGLEPQSTLPSGARVTNSGNIRVIDLGLIRVIS